MYIFDSVKKEKVEFVSLIPNVVTMYVCGPTVYDDAHLGHARSALSFDMLFRTLRSLGYSVNFIRNFTDVDDKIIKKMQDSGKNLKEITEYYIQRYNEDMDALNIMRPTITPKATENIEAMQDMIKNLLAKNIAYKISNGDIYFDTSKDNLYGKLSNKVNDETLSRIESVSEKRSDKDFALWKACNENDIVCFDASFGKGRPGWHIECSAMIEKHTKPTGGYSIDIHGGGADLLFPHHENEASQSRCATGHELAKYWMHNGFVQIDGEKMSKSLGNSFFLKDTLKVYNGEIVRFYLSGIHYRNDFNFNEEDLLNSKKRLDKLYRLKKRVFDASASKPNVEFKKLLLEAMSDDLNISVALSLIDEMIAKSNESLDVNINDKNAKKEIMANIEFINELLGFGYQDPFGYFQLGLDDKLVEKINSLIKQRTEAKSQKNFALADKIRDELKEMDINIMDTPNGTLWEKIS
ncbi:MAG: cysteine--tRNA ligase [Epsilonproteobacteria bacterium]|nr:cysteine--tRNA ligase [Campylobacterota bacterium]